MIGYKIIIGLYISLGQLIHIFFPPLLQAPGIYSYCAYRSHDLINRPGIRFCILRVDKDGLDSISIAGIDGLSVSPDGKMLAFTRKQSLALIRVDGSGIRELYTKKGPENEFVGTPVWTKDSRTILFVEGPNQGGKLMRLSIEGGEPAFTGLEDVRNQFSLSPDGTRVAFPRRAASTPEIVEVWAIDNLLAKAR